MGATARWAVTTQPRVERQFQAARWVRPDVLLWDTALSTVGATPDGIAAEFANDDHMPRSLVRAAALGLLFASPLVSWWHVGPLDFGGQSEVTANVLFHPPSMSEAMEAGLGRTATAVMAVSAMLLVVGAGRGVVDPRGWRVLIPLVLLGGFCGAYWRVLTATTAGYDLGGTLSGIVVAVPFGLIVVLGLVVWACLGWDSL